MAGRLARRILLKSTLSAGAILAAGRLANSRPGAAGGGSHDSRETETLLRYAGEFGGSGKRFVDRERALNGRF
jgi:hypothetical protein